MDFLKHAAGGDPKVTLSGLAVHLGIAFVMGFLAAGVYGVACRRSERRPEPSFLATLVLLSLLIALVTLAIGDNVARAFSLVGTLAIVRFRTVVEDTRDTAFVIYAVACGMCAGSGYYLGPVLAAPLVLLATWIFSGRRRSGGGSGSGRLILRLSIAMNLEGAFKNALEQHFPGNRLVGLTTAKGGSSWDAIYSVTLPEPGQVYRVVDALSAIEGVQEVELKSD